MSKETTQFDELSVANALPRAKPPSTPDFLADWARQINERERAVGQELQASSGVRATPRREGSGRHFGRHRHDEPGY